MCDKDLHRHREQVILDVAVGKGEAGLTRVFARCFANPTKLVLALREIRAERSRIEQISRTKDLIYKEAGGHVGRPMGAVNESHAHKHSGGRVGGKKKKRMVRTARAAPHQNP
jgi:hypothetical protein